MVNRILTLTAAGALLVATGLTVNAQGGGANTPNVAPGASGQANPGAAQPDAQTAPGEQGGRKGASDDKAAQPKSDDKNAGAAAQPGDKASGKKAEGGDKPAESTQPKDRAADSKPMDDKRQNAGDNTSRDNQKDGQRDNAKADDKNRDKDVTKTKVTINNDQRTRIKTVIRGENKARANVSFNVTIGQRVPKTVTYYSLPPTIIEIVPQYSAYQYVLVGDNIIIIEPETGLIVDVIPA